MKLSRRSYPHPVIGNHDDVPGAAFQPTLEVSADPDNLYVDVAVQCSSSTLRKLIAEGRATYAVHVECTNTVFRRAYEFTENTKRVTIPADQLNDAVEINCFAAATQHISGYSVEKAHADYAGASFDVRKGDILAIGAGQVFDIETAHDALSRIGSIMIIDETKDDGDRPMTLDFSGEKIRVILSRSDFKTYKLLRQSEAMSNVLTTMIVLPALLETLYQMGNGDDGEFESLRWHRVLARRIEDMGLGARSDNLSKVQRILEFPVKRALAVSMNFAEAAF